jgi:uroporphyrinogen decarboxylase
MNSEHQSANLEQARATLERFNRRFDEAHAKAPPSKRWTRRALHRQGAGRCPVRLKRLSLDLILHYPDELADLFTQYPDDTIFVPAYEFCLGYRPLVPVDPLRALTETAEWTDEWGTVWHHSAGGVGATPARPAISDWDQLEDYLARRIPNPRAPGRLDAALPALTRHGGNRYFAGMTHFLLFERLHAIRGMENVFEDFYANPEPLDRLLGVLTDYYIEIIREWGKWENVDAVFMTDDWGTQQSLMISPDLWKKFFAARYRRICDEAHRFGMDVIFHSCGNVLAIVGDLIDAGVDVLDPIQPDAMDLKALAREYGGKVALSGGISDQRLARWTPAQVKDEIRRTIDLLGKAFDNAYLVAPSNVLTPEIPLANLVSMFEACHEC